MSDPVYPEPEFRTFDVTVRVMHPRVDWLARLLDAELGPRCRECRRPLPDDHIILNTESRNPTSDTEDQFCSWGCVLIAAASTVLHEGEAPEGVKVTDIEDWRGR